MVHDEWDRQIPEDEQFREVAKILAVALLRYRDCPPVPNKPEASTAPSPPASSPAQASAPDRAEKKRRQPRPSNSIPRPEFDTDAFIRTKAQELCCRPDFSQSDFEDLCQELHLYLASKVHLYDPARGPMVAFVTTVIYSGIGMYLRYRNRPVRRLLDNAVSLERFRIRSGGRSERRVAIGRLIPDRRSNPIERIGTREALEFVIRRCSIEEREHLRLVLERGVQSTARAHAVSRRRILNSLTRIRRFFEKAGFCVC